ncbi:MAG: phosphoribosyl-ATP diphosphatase [Acidobacteriota bacterium]
MEKNGKNLEFLNSLEALIRGRKAQPVEGSYTNFLFDRGLPEIIRKVGEEAVEVMVSTLESRERTVSESADLLYHLLVLLVEQDLSLEDVVGELESRHRK